MIYLATVLERGQGKCLQGTCKKGKKRGSSGMEMGIKRESKKHTESAGGETLRLNKALEKRGGRPRGLCLLNPPPHTLPRSELQRWERELERWWAGLRERGKQPRLTGNRTELCFEPQRVPTFPIRPSFSDTLRVTEIRRRRKQPTVNIYQNSSWLFPLSYH